VAEEREVVIKISAKNLTQAEFKKARAGLAGIGSSAGGAKAKTSGLQRAFTSFGKAAPGALKIVTGAAAATGAAIAGVTATVIALGQRGAAIADVKEAFNKLSTSAGETGAVMLGALQQGVKSTVTNFELMKLANTALGAGLLKTSTDAQTLGEGARLLAKRTGTDTAQAFNTLTTAMASGRTAQLKQLGLFVDNKKAVEDYAEAQGRSVSSLTDVDRANALQVATLAALRQELANNAPPLADFGELIEQGRVAVTNLVDGVAVMISQSPPLLAGMQAVKEIITSAFGGEQQSLVLGIVNAIERAALFIIELGKAGITTAQFLREGFAGIEVMVLGIGVAFSSLSSTILESIASTFEAAASIPVLGKAWEVQAGFARDAADAVSSVNGFLKEEIEDAALAATGTDAFGLSLEAAKVALDDVETSMVNAGLSQRELTLDTEDAKTKNENLQTSLVGVGEEMLALSPIMTGWKEKLAETKAEAELYGDTYKEILKEASADTDMYGEKIDGLAVLVAADSENMRGSFETFGIETKHQMAATVRQMEKDFKKIKESGLATSKDLKKAEEELQEARREMSGETTGTIMANESAIQTGTMQLLGVLGEKYKAAAIATAIISTYQAIAKALASAVWPFSLILAAGAAAAGWANVSKIKSSSSHREGTSGLDYQDFGAASLATLHGREAVIPRGGGHQLAEEIAIALARQGRPGRGADDYVERFERIVAKLEALPRAIQRSVRDGVILAS
jgi:hypothetical protein